MISKKKKTIRALELFVLFFSKKLKKKKRKSKHWYLAIGNAVLSRQQFGHFVRWILNNVVYSTHTVMKTNEEKWILVMISSGIVETFSIGNFYQITFLTQVATLENRKKNDKLEFLFSIKEFEFDSKPIKFVSISFVRFRLWIHSIRMEQRH